MDTKDYTVGRAEVTLFDRSGNKTTEIVIDGVRESEMTTRHDEPGTILPLLNGELRYVPSATEQTVSIRGATMTIGKTAIADSKRKHIKVKYLDRIYCDYFRLVEDTRGGCGEYNCCETSYMIYRAYSDGTHKDFEESTVEVIDGKLYEWSWLSGNEKNKLHLSDGAGLRSKGVE